MATKIKAGLPITIDFPAQPQNKESFAKSVVARCQIRDGLSELFDLTIQVLLLDPAVDYHRVLGEQVKVSFADEPTTGQPVMQGIVTSVRQLSDPRRQASDAARESGAERLATFYELKISPPLWLTTRRSDYRIFEGKTVVEIVQQILTSDYQGRIPAPTVSASPRKRRYVAQYGETDFDFIARLLADEGLVWYFDHENNSNWVLIKDTTQEAKASPDQTSFIPATNLLVSGSHVYNVTQASLIQTSASHVRDYTYKKDYEYTDTSSPVDADATAPTDLVTNEKGLEAYSFGVGEFGSATTEGKARADDLLHGLRARARTYTLEANFTRGPGRKLTVADYPRNECNRTYVIVRSRIIMDDGASISADPETNLHLLECIPQEIPYVPLRRPKPRIHSSQTAKVIEVATGVTTHGADPLDENEPGGEDRYGRVRVRFPWGRKGGATRWVRVSQAWAGSGFGFFALPRKDDEVIISYLEGDPDQPLVTGRVHNLTRPNPVQSADVKKPISVWRSKSVNPADESGGPSEQGYNEILMDDSKGQERLDLHAQYDYHRTVEHDSTVYVKHNDFLTVDFNKTDIIKKAYSMRAGSVTISTGPYLLTAGTIKQIAKEFVYIKAGDYIMLECGGSSIQIFPDHIYIHSPQIQIEADAECLVQASLIDLNP